MYAYSSMVYGFQFFKFSAWTVFYSFLFSISTKERQHEGGVLLNFNDICSGSYIVLIGRHLYDKYHFKGLQLKDKDQPFPFVIDFLEWVLLKYYLFKKSI